MTTTTLIFFWFLGGGTTPAAAPSPTLATRQGPIIPASGGRSW
jgi:hypothetical protein